MSSKPTYNIAILLFKDADILDYAGPLEMLTHFTYNINDMSVHGGVFIPHLLGASPSINTGSCMTVNTDTLLSTAREKINDYDILLVPGTRPDIIMKMAKEDSEEVQFVRDFLSGKGKEAGKERIVLSICTGALFLGLVGGLKGLKKATTHHMALPFLRQMCEGEKNGVEIVENMRFVDGGVNEGGVRCLFAGGITCGLDAALELGMEKTDEKTAEWVAQMAEYKWQRT